MVSASEAAEILSKHKNFVFRDDYGNAVTMEQVIELLQKAPVWFDCDEHLPEDGELVITLIYGHDVITVNEGETLKEALERISHYARTSVGFYSEEDGGWCTSDGWPEICTPRFWMPIPDPPEERPDEKEKHE